MKRAEEYLARGNHASAMNVLIQGLRRFPEHDDGLGLLLDHFADETFGGGFEQEILEIVMKRDDHERHLRWLWSRVEGTPRTRAALRKASHFVPGAKDALEAVQRYGAGERAPERLAPEPPSAPDGVSSTTGPHDGDAAGATEPIEGEGDETSSESWHAFESPLPTESAQDIALPERGASPDLSASEPVAMESRDMRVDDLHDEPFVAPFDDEPLDGFENEAASQGARRAILFALAILMVLALLAALFLSGTDTSAEANAPAAAWETESPQGALVEPSENEHPTGEE